MAVVLENPREFDVQLRSEKVCAKPSRVAFQEILSEFKSRQYAYSAIRDLDLESEVDLVRDLSFPWKVRLMLHCLVHRAPHLQQQQQLCPSYLKTDVLLPFPTPKYKEEGHQDTMSMSMSMSIVVCTRNGRVADVCTPLFASLKANCSTLSSTPPPPAPVKHVMKPISASVKVNSANLNGETLKELHSKITLDTHFGHHLRELGNQRSNRPKNNHLLNGSRTVTEQRPASTKAATVMEQRDNRR